MKSKSLQTLFRGVAASTAFVVMVIAVSLSSTGCGDGTVPESDEEVLSDNANLSSLVAAPTNLNEAFAQNLQSYSMTVGNDTGSVTLTPTSANASATISVAGSSTVSGAASVVSLNALPELVTNILIIVTAEDGETQKTYTVEVTRSDLSDDASLSALTISSGNFVPSFSPEILDYQVVVSFDVSSVTITPFASQADATIMIDGIVNASGTASPAINLAEGENPIAIGVVAENGASTNNYSITVVRQSAVQFGLQGYIKSSNTTAQDAFGFAVALDGDTLVVGAPNEDSNATGVNGNQNDDTLTDSGAVYVFTRDTLGVWTQQAYLKASNSGALDKFGSSVSIDNDKLVVGAPNERSIAIGIDGDQADNSATDAGAVYVFVRNGTVWTQSDYIKASNTGAGDLFGTDVAILRETLVVSAIGEASNAQNIVSADQTDNSMQNSGAVYIFNRADFTTWSQHSYVKAPNTDIDDEFGFAIALGIDTLVVGAPGEASNMVGVNGIDTDNSAANSGAAYIFYRDINTDVWSVDSYFKASNSGAGDRFGESVDVEGQLLAVGAPLEDGIEGGEGVPIDDSGSIYTFKRNGGDLIWSQEAQIKAFIAEGGDQYGSSVKLSADLMIVGAPLEDSSSSEIDVGLDDNNAVDSGAVYTYTRNDLGGWNEHAFVKASNTDAGDHFGAAVTLSDDTMVIGAAEDDSIATGIDGDAFDNTATNSGATFVFNGLPITVEEPAKK